MKANTTIPDPEAWQAWGHDGGPLLCKTKTASGQPTTLFPTSHQTRRPRPFAPPPPAFASTTPSSSRPSSHAAASPSSSYWPHPTWPSPTSYFFERSPSIDPRLVTALFLILTVVQLVLTGSLKHLLLFFTPPRFFTLPSDREAAAVRTARNATRFRIHYTILIWVIILATLVPRRRLSLLLLLATSNVAVSYILLLRALPNSTLLHRSIDPRLVTALFLIVTVVQLVLTRALKHLLLSLAAGVSIVLIHAVFWVTDDTAANAGPSPLVRKFLNRIAPPSDPEAAAVRVVRNATRFRLYYTVLLWVVLFATLVPRRPTSLVCLVVTSEVAASYCMLMRAFPDSAILHQFIDRRLVGPLLLIVIVVELVLTGALQHLVLSMAAGASVIFIHAVFWVEEKGLLEEEEAADEDLQPIAADKNEGGDVESGPQ